MHVILNGDSTELPTELTAAQLLDRLGLRRELVVVERNQEVIPRGRLDVVRLEDGDHIEVIQMIAGG